ncbi:hypothetical protein MNBD_GAMMA25-1416 [hydrothermal vent metagenome]|uniref:Uncharacterized protein n=1 Tax=hydrothermal vent metagenome TaxID=652676 RepID=A0A3B1B2Y8_9ZZZZ
MSARDIEIEEKVLRESILSASGLNSEKLQIGIKGDPSLRETTYARKKYNSAVDRLYEPLAENFKELLLNRSTYRLYIGFNNGEIRTASVFDPMRIEVHEAEKMADRDYIKRQFPALAYEDKIRFVNDLYWNIASNPIYKKLPGYWQNILNKRNAEWEPMELDEITNIISTLKVLREMPEYYIRNVTICMVQSFVRIQFNCDGTQLVSAENYQHFLEENLIAE